MSELVNKLFKAMGGWKAVDDLIEEIRHGNMQFEKSSVSTICARLDNGIHNPFSGGLNNVRIELYPHDNCGSIAIDNGIMVERICFRSGTSVYDTVLEFYKNYEAAKGRNARMFFCLWDESTESYLD